MAAPEEPPLRILFVSWSSAGGSAMSQRQLASRLVLLGHQVRFVVRDPSARIWQRHLHDLLADLSVHLGSFGAPVSRLRNRVGARGHEVVVDGLSHVLVPIVHNAVPAALRSFRPDVVVASSVDRWSWRRIRQLCADARIPSVLYVREESSLQHLATGATPDLLLANTPSLAETLSAQGFACAYVPSVVDLETTRTVSTRRTALAVNPVSIKGADLVWDLARRVPDIPFAVQLTANMTSAERATALRQAATLPNVELREPVPAGPGLYGDARVLLAPYRVDSRPRVVLEAQANGIPVLASDVPAMVAAVGAGGRVQSVDDPDEWVAALTRLWQDESEYVALAAAAQAHASRPEVDPASIARDFAARLTGLLDARRPRWPTHRDRPAMVSVIVPVHNVAAYLDAALASIAEQTHREIEVILVDDGSVDGSETICDAWATRDDRFRVLHRPGEGASAARNAGIDASTGEFVMFADSDDVVAPRLVERMVQLADRYGADVVTVDSAPFDTVARLPEFTDDGPATVQSGPQTLREIVCEHPRWAPFGKLFRGVDLRACGVRFPVGLVHQDLHFTPRAYASLPVSVVTDDVLYAHRRRPGSITADRVRVRSVDLLTILDENLAHAATIGLTPRDQDAFVGAYLLHASKQIEAMHRDGTWAANQDFRDAYVRFARRHARAMVRNSDVSAHTAPCGSRARPRRRSSGNCYESP